MTPINNSDTAWLIVSDYNQDNDLYHEELRDDILDPDVNQQWSCEMNYDIIPDFDGNGGIQVGGEHDYEEVGNDEYDLIIGSQDLNGGSNERGVIGERVGGNHYNDSY
jgi:hypothetical protein